MNTLNKIIEIRRKYSKYYPIFTFYKINESLIQDYVSPYTYSLRDVVRFVNMTRITRRHVDIALSDLIAIYLTIEAGRSPNAFKERRRDIKRLVRDLLSLYEEAIPKYTREYFYLVAEVAFLLGTYTGVVLTRNQQREYVKLYRYKNTLYVFGDMSDLFRKVVIIFQTFMLYYNFNYKLQYHNLDDGCITFLGKCRFSKKGPARPLEYPRNDERLQKKKNKAVYYDHGFMLLATALAPEAIDMEDHVPIEQVPLLSKTLCHILSNMIETDHIYCSFLRDSFAFIMLQRLRTLEEKVPVNFYSFDRVKCISHLLNIINIR